MRTKAEVLEEHYGVTDIHEARVLKYADYKSPLPPLDQWTTMKLPYEAAEHPDLPSLDEIERGMQENKLTQPAGLFPVCRVGKCVVKLGTDRRLLQEAENLLFLEKHSQVRAPKLYAAYARPRNPFDVYYLVTEFIEGETLSQKKWLALDEDTQEIICSKLAKQFQLLQSVPSEGYYGRIYRQGWTPIYNLLRVRGLPMCGPYNTFEELISAMYTAAELRRAHSNIIPEFDSSDIEFLSKYKSILGGIRDREPVLTHLDPKWENMIIRPIKDDGKKIIDWEVVLIDWDFLGWLPPFMQVASLQFRIALYNKEDRKTFLKRMFAKFEESYPEELEFLEKSYDTVNYCIF